MDAFPEFMQNPMNRVPEETPRSGRCKAGTRTIHAFGGRRVTP